MSVVVMLLFIKGTEPMKEKCSGTVLWGIALKDYVKISYNNLS